MKRLNRISAVVMLAIVSACDATVSAPPKVQTPYYKACLMEGKAAFINGWSAGASFDHREMLPQNENPAADANEKLKDALVNSLFVTGRRSAFNSLNEPKTLEEANVENTVNATCKQLNN